MLLLMLLTVRYLNRMTLPIPQEWINGNIIINVWIFNEHAFSSYGNRIIACIILEYSDSYFNFMLKLIFIMAFRTSFVLFLDVRCHALSKYQELIALMMGAWEKGL